MTPATQEELNMGKDTGWKEYFSDNERYADVINGLGCEGKQLVKATDLCEDDSHAGKKARDLLRKTAFGMNFALIGIENQETIDYALPLRNMNYDAWNYERQAVKIRKEVRSDPDGLSAGEYLYGFRKDSKLNPVITFVLYSGKEAWNGPTSLHEMLDFTNIPESLREMTPDYRIHVIEIRKLENTEVFQTDVRQVFDFIRYSEDKKALQKLVESDAYYQNMEEDAYDVVALYTNSTELVQAKDYQRKDGKIDMCRAITELIEDGRAEGRSEGIAVGIETGRREGIEAGRAEGADFFATLTQRLIMEGRMDDLMRATSDKEFRNTLYSEYGMGQ